MSRGWRRGVTRASILLASILLASGLASMATAQDMRALWDRASQAWLRGEQEQAIRSWERLREAGIEDPDLEYDLGTAYAETGKLGRAVWHFELALTLRPDDEDARAGLDAARTAIGRRLAQSDGEATVTTRLPMSEAIVAPFTERFLAVFAVALNALFFALLVLRRYTQEENRRLALAVAAPLVALLLCASLWGLGVKRGAFANGEAAVVLDDTRLSAGPDPRATARGAATEGERARIVDTDGDFMRVELSGDRHGWLTARHLGKL